MKCYRLKSSVRAERILSGEQMAVLVMPREATSSQRHVVGGQGMVLRIARTSKPSQDTHFEPMICSVSAEVVMNETGVVRVLNAKPVNAGTVERIHALLLNAEPSSPGDTAEHTAKLARALGFDNWAALWAEHGSKTKKEVLRAVIGWLPPVALAETVAEGAAA